MGKLGGMAAAEYRKRKAKAEKGKKRTPPVSLARLGRKPGTKSKRRVTGRPPAKRTPLRATQARRRGLLAGGTLLRIGGGKGRLGARPRKTSAVAGTYSSSGKPAGPRLSLIRGQYIERPKPRKSGALPKPRRRQPKWWDVKK